MQTVYQLMRLNRALGGWRLKVAGVAVADRLGLRHLSVRIDPILACNLRCVMCHYSDPEARKEHRGRLDGEDLRRVAQLFFHKALQVVVGVGSEPTLHSAYVDIVRTAKQEHAVPQVGLTTNAQRLDETQVDALCRAGLDEITISLHGVRATTYERLMVGASHARLHRALALLTRVRHRLGDAAPHVRLNYTANPENLDELAAFFDEFGRHAIDTLQVRPAIEKGTVRYDAADKATFRRTYPAVVRSLARQCGRRGMTLLAPVELAAQPGAASFGGILVDCLVRYVGPQRIWREDFDWRNETYEEYCRRTGWRWELVAGALASAPPESGGGFNSLSYDVLG